MRCIVAGPNVKILGKAIHTLAKIGDELYLESLQSGLAVRTVNASRSAFAGFTFPPSFFLEYDERNDDNDGSNAADNAPTFKGKLAVRSVLFVFKRLADMDKSVERCVLTADSTDSRVVFTFHCKYGIVKTHKLAYIESETLVVNHDKSGVPNRIVSHPSVFLDTAACFHANVDEIVFEPLFDRLVVRNHCDEMDLVGGGGGGGAADPAKMSSVKYSLCPEEFDVYVVKDSTRSGVEKSRGVTALDDEALVDESAAADADKRLIRFCLKELRALLSFAETYATSMGVYFGEAGEPIVFTLDSDPGYEADFVFATSPPDDGGGGGGATNGEARAPAPPPSPLRPTSSTSRRSSRASPVKRAILTQHSQLRHGERTKASRLDNTLNASSTFVNDGYGVHDISSSGAENEDRRGRGEGGNGTTTTTTTTTPTTVFVKSAEAEAKRKATLQKLLGDDDDDDSDEDPPGNTGDGHKTESVARGRANAGRRDDDREATKATAVAAKNTRRIKPSLLPEFDDPEEEEEEEEEEENVPTTPPSKKFKSIFGFTDSQTQHSVKTLKSQQSSSASATQRQILAEDSEED